MEFVTEKMVFCKIRITAHISEQKSKWGIASLKFDTELAKIKTRKLPVSAGTGGSCDTDPEC